jgi:hypothetical protein
MTKYETFFKTVPFDGAVKLSATTISYSGYGYGRHNGGKTHLYGYDPKGEQFSYIVTFHRSKVIAQMIRTGEWWELTEKIRSNYSTNGYTTRVGIKRANLARCAKMMKSHQAIPDAGKAAHDARVIMRNK